MNYFEMTEVSNSDLSALKEYLECADRSGFDRQKAYAFGTLFDAIVTEPHRVDFLKRTLDGNPVSDAEFLLAQKMKTSLLKDSFAYNLIRLSTTQKIAVETVQLCYNNVPFELRMRCKLDWSLPNISMAADLKSTACTSQEQFDEAILHFDYDRQAAVYMTIEKLERFAIVGVSKRNKQVFKTMIDKASPLYQSGMDKFVELAFKWYTLFC